MIATDYIDTIYINRGGMEIPLHRNSFTTREWYDLLNKQAPVQLAQTTDIGSRPSIWPACPLY
ncbi:MAG: hypothetical protein WBM08_00015 [Prochlorococcaceae cyanobacterium]